MDVKTTNCILAKKTIQFTEDGVKKEVFIEYGLDDTCGNGYEVFHYGTTISRVARNGRRVLWEYGVNIDVAKEAKLEIVEKLQGTNYLGEPSCYLTNALYFIHNAGMIDKAKEYLRVTDEEMSIIRNYDNENALEYILIKLGIKERWKKEAEEAIALIEKETGVKFVHKKTSWDDNRNDSIMSDTLYNSIKKADERGYFSEEMFDKRRQDKILKELEDEIKRKKRINEDNKHDIFDKINVDDIICDIVINNFDKFENAKAVLCEYIFYPHNRTLSFNWNQYHSYNINGFVSDNDFEIIFNLLKKNEYFNSIKIENKNK